MNRCDRARPWIVRCVEGELSPDEALRLARHLDACTRCRIVLARERRLGEMLDGLTDPLEVEPAFFESVMASLPHLPVRSALHVSSRPRWRRGLKLAALGGLASAVGVAAARLLPAVRLDIAAPAMPRFAPESADGWLGLLGSAVQWVRVTAESIAWSGASASPDGSPLGAAAATATIGAVLVVAASLGLALAARAGSRASS